MSITQRWGSWHKRYLPASVEGDDDCALLKKDEKGQ
jgi:hypothetical protein